MDNPETMTMLEIQDAERRKKNTTQKTKKMSNTNTTNNPGINPGAHEG